MISVFGHRNPDSDAICTAVVTAWWLNQRSQQVQAWRLGDINRETRFLFARAGIAPPPLLEESRILGIIDHHRLGGLFTREPADICIRPYGSSAAVLWERLTPEEKRALPRPLAILQPGAILSDTVAFRPPTTTEADRQAAETLPRLADETSADLCVLMLTDISHACSELFFAGPLRIADSPWREPGMLSRKKQLLPWPDARLDALRRSL